MDRAWWRRYLGDVRQTFGGILVSSHPQIGEVRKVVCTPHENSGAGAVALAAYMGARRVILLGYDCQRTGGRTHWHGDHPEGLGNAGSMPDWPAQFARLAARLSGVEVINCSRETALRCWPRGDLEEELMDKPPILVEGMHGMGDNLHQRAVVRHLMQTREVWLETPWPSIYHDMPGLHLMQKGSKLRTQAKNLMREKGQYSSAPCPPGTPTLRVSYPPSMVREHRSVLAAMCAKAGVPVGDFRMPVPDSWQHGLDLPKDKPVLAFRPLVERSEWGGNRNRNPDVAAYLRLFESIRDRFFVVSVADLEEGKEWMVHPAVKADLTLHRGELEFKRLAALWRDAALVFTAPGFGVVLAQAVGTPVVSVFGGYEGSYSFAEGAKHTPTLAIAPIKECDCFSHTHRCDKTIDVPNALERLARFTGEHIENVNQGLQAHPLA